MEEEKKILEENITVSPEDKTIDLVNIGDINGTSAEEIVAPENPIDTTKTDTEAHAEPSKEDTAETERNITEEILRIVLESESDEVVRDEIDNYHDNDIAEALSHLSKSDRIRLYRILGNERISEIFTYYDDVTEYLEELGLEQAADVIENMDADDAVDVLEEIEDEETREQIISLMEPEATEDILLIKSYDDDEIGSIMTTNYVSIPHNSTVKQAMRQLVSQAGDNDNINTLYVVDDEGKYYGAIELRDLICARKETELEEIISTGYPCISAKARISESIESIKDYAEDSLPIVDENKNLIGVITSTDVTEAVQDELSDDYAKFAGMTEEADLKEKLSESMKKRLPWLGVLFLLGLGVSSVVGLFESIVAEVAVIVLFQSLILEMAGNGGTQSLAVTIRVLMEENISSKEKMMFILKEMRVGAVNGLILGLGSVVCISAYLVLFKDLTIPYGLSVSVCVGVALFLSMIIASFVGSAIPMLLQKLKFDPAVASGPLITTMNDLLAVVTYYGLADLLLIKFLKM